MKISNAAADAKKSNEGRIDRTSQKKTFIVFSAILFLIIFVAGSIAFIFSMQQIIRNNKGSELTQMIEIERIKLEASVNNQIALVLKMASSPLIRDFFAGPDDAGLAAYAFAEIADYRRTFNDTKVFWINDIDKMFYYDEDTPFVLDTEAPENYWYPLTLYQTQDYNFNINYNDDIKALNIWINAPVVSDDHTPLGAIGIGIDLSVFIDKLYQTDHNGADIYFFNKSGEITGAMDVELVAQKKKIWDEFDTENYDVYIRALKLDPEETQTFNVPNGKVAIGTVPVLEWYSVAFTPDRLRDYNNAMTALFLVVLGIILVIFITFNIFAARILNSLHITMMDLKSASKSKSDFLAKMSHEIRTPMNAIIGMAELAIRENLPPVAYEHVVTIKHAGGNLLSIVNDILDFSKIESGRLEIVPGEYLFSSMVNDVISIIRMRIMDKHLRFVANIDSSIPNALFGDEIRIRQALLNILSNAVKYTEEGHVSLTVTGEKMSDDIVFLTIEVEDSGIGIKPEDIGKLFGDFIQVDMAGHKGVEGTGLGLAITRNLIKSMGGDITVRSEYGKGSTFTATLPQKIRSHEKIAHVEEPAEKSVIVYSKAGMAADSLIGTINGLGVGCTHVLNDSGLYEALVSGKYRFVFVASALYENVKDLCTRLRTDIKIVMLTDFNENIAEQNISILAMPVHSMSVADMLNGLSDGFSYGEKEDTSVGFTAPEAVVLVVDDINTNLKVAEGLLMPYQVKVDLCKSGMEALDAVKGNRYDLIFMDHMMPELNGIEATLMIRAFVGGEYYKSLPIVALTANAVSGTKEMFLQNGFNDFLSKPIDRLKLNTILERWIPKEKQKKIAVGSKATAAALKRNGGLDIEIRGVDVRKGIAQVGGSAEFYMKTLSVFYREGLAKIKAINDSLETDNMPLYAIYVHALKSACANIGALKLSDDAKALEMAGKQEDISFINAHNKKFIEGIETLLQNIAKILPENNQPKPAASEAIRAILIRLKEALDDFDSDGINQTVNELQQYRSADGVQAILENVLIGEYEEAMAMIDAIL